MIPVRTARRQAAVSLSVLAAWMCALAGAAQPAWPAEQVDVDRLIQERVDRGFNVSIVVGIIDAEGPRYHAHGKLGKDRPAMADQTSLYEIGSVTKTFTTVLLADMVRRGEVGLNDPVQKYLPDKVRVPRDGDRQITLVDLATHVSGLPMTPANAHAEDPLNPYAGYNVDQLYEFLSSYKLPKKIGTSVEYSNLGMGLLGHALALRAGTGYSELVRSRICDPLGMRRTYIDPPASEREHLATGYGSADTQVTPFDMSSLEGAGDYRSSAEDLIRYVAANLGLTDTPLAAALNSSHEVLRQEGLNNSKIALGWLVLDTAGRSIIYHPGGTYGFRSLVAFDKAARRGVVVLTNSTRDVADLGLHILDPSIPLAAITEVAPISADILDAFVGLFRIDGGVVFEFLREGDSLMVLQEGVPKIRIYPQDDSTFFYKTIDAKFTFIRDARGQVNRIILHQFGRQMNGQRITREQLPREIQIDAKLLDDYVGLFRFSPELTFEFVRDGDKLMVLQAGAPRMQVYPESQETFFYKTVDAKFTFIRDADGKVNRATLHQFGREMPGHREQ